MDHDLGILVLKTSPRSKQVDKRIQGIFKARPPLKKKHKIRHDAHALSVGTVLKSPSADAWSRDLQNTTDEFIAHLATQESTCTTLPTAGKAKAAASSNVSKDGGKSKGGGKSKCGGKGCQDGKGYDGWDGKGQVGCAQMWPFWMNGGNDMWNFNPGMWGGKGKPSFFDWSK